MDDDQQLAEMLGEVLRDADYAAVTAADGQQALGCLDEVRPDLVLSDLMMPVMTGRELGLAMQAEPQYRAIPVVLMSAVSRLRDIEECKFVAVLRKPFDLDFMLSVVASALV